MNLCGTAKAVPFQNTAQSEFFRSLEAVPFQSGGRTIKPER
jgi:hypothetical protein